ATLFPVGIAAKRMLAAKAWGKPPLLEGVVQRRLRLHEIADGQEEGGDEFLEEQGFRCLIEGHWGDLVFMFSSAGAGRGRSRHAEEGRKGRLSKSSADCAGARRPRPRERAS